MSFAEGKIDVPSSLRYRTIQNGQNARHLVYVLHGYGQLVEYFSQKFSGIPHEEILFVFPEGRHRFYLRGTSGRVGASWMTKEWREEDIRLNIVGLDLLHQEILKSYSPEKITVIGFSQGGATAARWLANGKITCDHFISWASVYPPDLAIEAPTELAQKNTFVLGTEDEYFPKEDQEILIADYRSKGIRVAHFEGTHDIDKEILTAIL
ncbi:alpha/beta hydrolase [Fluviicola chungangensis]|uniref:Phospholipase n=1 Tax=Fluviicola chungangensis TaxID=2597671 RepID=A0A556N7P6_9FLAO|nr:phospholipase [Fluviicola chungangensis]TSJ48131.1 phospholipase [Fluviicola chungangensis]